MLSDRIGRKPPLVFGTLGLAAAVTGFGLLITFVSLAIFRSLQGVFNDNIGIMKAVLAEITDSSNVARGEVCFWRYLHCFVPYLSMTFGSIFYDSNDVGIRCDCSMSGTHVSCTF